MKRRPRPGTVVQILDPPTGPIDVAPDVREEQSEYLRQALSANTKRAYASDWKIFMAWCAANKYRSLPADPRVVAAFITVQARERSVATLQRRLVAISVVHKHKNLESPTAHPTVRKLMQGIRRQKGTKQVQREPLMAADLRRIMDQIPDTPYGRTERAVLLVGFMGAFRRSELVGLTCSDLKFSDEGVAVNLRRSKTDQTGEGVLVGIERSGSALCPVTALEEALDGREEGHVFLNRWGKPMHPDCVYRMVRKYCAQVGLDPARYGAHSLRTGFATQAATAEVPMWLMMQQGRWKDPKTVMRYIQSTKIFGTNLTRKLGL